MAHNLNFNQLTQQYACFTAGKAAWHNLGQNVAEAQSWADAMRLGGLDYEVFKAQLEYSGALVDAWGMFRADNGAFLGAVGEGYTPLQNRYAFDFVDSLLEAENGAHYDSAGALGAGERFWVSARVPYQFKVGGVDEIETYLLFASSHDTSIASSARLSTVRTVCQNTLTQALRAGSGVVKVKHTKDAQRRLDSARRLMSGVAQDVETLKEKLEALAVRKMTRLSLVGILDKLFPKNEEGGKQTRRDNILSDVLARYESNDGNAIPEQRGTAYNLLNAITGYVDHERTARITSSRAGMSEVQARAENAVFGSGDKLKSQALDVILLDTAGNEVVERRIYSIPDPVVAPSPVSFGGFLDDVLNATTIG